MRNYLTDLFRALASAGVLLSAVVHLDLYEVEDFRAVHTIGPLFLLNFIGGLIIGVAVLVWRHWFPALMAAGFGAVTVAAFWISVTHGLFGVHETATGWSEELAEAAEYAAIIFGVSAAALLWRPVRTVTWLRTAPPSAPQRPRAKAG